MREYGKIHSSFWTSNDIRSMTEDGRTLAAYLLTSPHSNMLGCFRIPLAYVSDDLKWTLERVSEGFAELFAKGFATLNEGSNWVVIHKFLKWNQPENPNVVKAAEKLFAQIPSNSGVKSILAWSIAEFESRFSVDKLAECKPFINPFDTLRKAYRKPEPEPEPQPEPEREPEPSAKADAIASPKNAGGALVAPQNPEAISDGLTPHEAIFRIGVPWLVSHAGPDVKESNIRSMLGGAEKHLTEAGAWQLVQDCMRVQPLEPIRWLAAALNERKKVAASPTQRRSGFPSQAELDAENAKAKAMLFGDSTEVVDV